MVCSHQDVSFVIRIVIPDCSILVCPVHHTVTNVLGYWSVDDDLSWIFSAEVK